MQRSNLRWGLRFARCTERVGVQIRREAPLALGVHCLNHNLQLIIQEAASVNFFVSDALVTVQSICNLVKSSPKRLTMFQSIQQPVAYARGGGGGGVSGVKPPPPLTIEKNENLSFWNEPPFFRDDCRTCY